MVGLVGVGFGFDLVGGWFDIQLTLIRILNNFQSYKLIINLQSKS